MFGLFKLKKKSKKEKNVEQQSSPDDEKENTSSPTKSKKVDKKSDKNSSDQHQQISVDNNDVIVEKQQTIDIEIVTTTTKTHNKDQRSATLPVTPSIPRNKVKINAQQTNNDTLTVETDLCGQGRESQPSPLSTATTTINIHGHRAPMLSSSDAHTNSFVRGNFLSSTISGSDLHRFLNSGYINGDPYLQRGVELKSPKSPHFHRPPNFSYSRGGPNYITSRNRHASANRVSASSSDAPRYSRNTLSGIARNRSSSPSSFQQIQQQLRQQPAVDTTTETTEQITKEDGSTTIVTTIRTHKAPVDLDTEEPIRLAKYPGAHQPDPDEEPIIESLDWPAPPYPAAVPELRARSRSSSNRRAPSTINSVHGTHLSVNGDEEEDSDEDTDLHDEEVHQVLINNSCMSQDLLGGIRHSTGATSVSSSLARVKASKPNCKLNYHNNLFDNDYNDYLLQYRADKDWKKMVSKSTLQRSLGGGGHSNGNSVGEDLNGTIELDEEEEELRKELSGKHELNESKSEEVKKIKNESGMAAELLADVERQQKLMIARKLKVDPWKASRTPSAKAEPSVRTRYESPVNASPSRVYNYPNTGRSLMTSAMSGNALSATPVPGQSQTTSATFIGDISLVTNTPITPTHQQRHYINLNNAMVMSPLTPQSINSLNRSNNINCNNNQYVSSSSRIISSSCLPKAVPRPGYGLSTPNKSITLPNSARYSSAQRAYDFDSPYFSQPRDATSQCNVNEADKINIYNMRQQNYATVCKSTPNLIGNPKIYPYEVLRRNREKKVVLTPDIDRERLERHLSPDEFQQIFGMNIETFYTLPDWQRTNLKKKAKLF